MPKIEITIEKAFRRAIALNVSDDVYDCICRSGYVPHDTLDPLIEQMPMDESTHVGTDYAVWDPNRRKTLIPWD